MNFPYRVSSKLVDTHVLSARFDKAGNKAGMIEVTMAEFAAANGLEFWQPLRKLVGARSTRARNIFREMPEARDRSEQPREARRSAIASCAPGSFQRPLPAMSGGPSRSRFGRLQVKPTNSRVCRSRASSPRDRRARHFARTGPPGQRVVWWSGFVNQLLKRLPTRRTVSTRSPADGNVDVEPMPAQHVGEDPFDRQDAVFICGHHDRTTRPVSRMWRP